MSSGVAYVLDTQDNFPERCNTELVGLLRIEDQAESEALRPVIEWHASKTRSKHAESILEQWDQVQGQFWRVLPNGTNTSARDFVDAGEYNGKIVSASR
jgi:glutamate synthase domain-containing protein 3